MGNLHLDFGEFNLLMGVEASQVFKLLTSALTPFRRYRNLFGRCQKRLLMPFVAFLGSGFARSLRFSLVSLVWRVRGGWATRILRILTKPGFKLFYALDQLSNGFTLLQDQCPYRWRRLLPVLFADGQFLQKILQRHPGTLQFQSLFALSSTLQFPLHEKPEKVPLIMRAWQKNYVPPEQLRRKVSRSIASTLSPYSRSTYLSIMTNLISLRKNVGQSHEKALDEGF
jgi:hypothetical protein